MFDGTHLDGISCNCGSCFALIIWSDVMLESELILLAALFTCAQRSTPERVSSDGSIDVIGNNDNNLSQCK